MIQMISKLSAILSLLIPTSLYAQDPREAEGYFTDPKSTPFGIICSNNYTSAIYIVQNGTLQELLSAPGCGNYTTLSFDRTRVGLKLVGEDGTQTPAILDLTTRSVLPLSASGRQIGQVSFAADGRAAFTRGEDLVIAGSGVERVYPLGTYANLAPISPDGSKVAFNDGNDQIWIMDLEPSRKSLISDGPSGYFDPVWSPDGTKLMYSSLNGMVKVYSIETKKTYDLGEGAHASWSENSREVVFYRRVFQGSQLVNTDLFISTFDGTEIQRLTSSPDVMEMDPSFVAGGNQIVFHTYDRRTIGEARLVPKGGAVQRLTARGETVLPGSAQMSIKPVSLKPSTENVTQLDIPYVHQAYDTPDWFNGDWACAPTQAIMLLAYYNVLPPWPTPCSTPTFHYNNWGNYVSTQYQFRQVQYIQMATDASGRASWGGYGYMWNGSYSPHSRMADYFRNHGLTAVQSEGTAYSVAFSDITAGYPFSMCVMLTSAGHLVLAHGIGAEPHTFVFNDPWGDKNRGYKNYYGKNARYDWPGYNNGYQNLTGVAWCISTRYTPIVANDTIVDDLQFGQGFFMQTGAPSSMSLCKDRNLGYQGHSWYVYSRDSGPVDACYATWTPVIPEEGKYEVSAYVPSFANATDARYSVASSDGIVSKSVNQSDHGDSWVSLGTYPFAKGNGGSVRLGDASTTAGQVLGFDAVRWSRTQNPVTAVMASQEIPRTVALLQNYPNPFSARGGSAFGGNPTTAISYQLPAPSAAGGSALSDVRLTVYDMLGREVASLVHGVQTAGSHSVRWNASSLPSGVYTYRLEVRPLDGRGVPLVESRKMILMK
jgi:WD40 repeat protein